MIILILDLPRQLCYPQETKGAGIRLSLECLVFGMVSFALVTMVVSVPLRAMTSVCTVLYSHVQCTVHYLLYYAVTHIINLIQTKN